MTIVEAWEIARPWFVDPNAGKFAMNAVHPEHWFQGEYDLVYRWNNDVRIVDCKLASFGMFVFCDLTVVFGISFRHVVGAVVLATSFNGIMKTMYFK